MNRISKLMATSALLSLVVVNAFSQDEQPVQLGADIMSRYIWRGVNLGGSSPSLQPWIKYNMINTDSNHTLSVGVWSAYTFSQTSNQEVDLFLTYDFKNVISLTVTDYFFPEYYSSRERNRYFNYDKDSTCHVIEGIISFNGTEKIPFTFMFAMNFYGNDARKINSDGSAGNIFMSKYVELGYKKNINGVDLNAFIGATIDKPDNDRGEVGYYGNKTSGVINLGLKVSKSIQVSDNFDIPVQASIITNPEAENIFMVFGFSF